MDIDYLKKITRLTQVHKDVQGKLNEWRESIVSNTRSLMKEISVASVAVSTAGIIALGIDLIPINVGPILVGITILLANAVGVFFYNTMQLRRETKNIIKAREEVLDPINEVITLLIDYKEKKISEREYEEKAEPLWDQLGKAKRAGHDFKEIVKGWGTSNADVYFTVTFAIGLCFFLYGLISPHALSM